MTSILGLHRTPAEAQELSDAIWRCRRIIVDHDDAIIFHTAKGQQAAVEQHRADRANEEAKLERLLKQQG